MKGTFDKSDIGREIVVVRDSTSMVLKKGDRATVKSLSANKNCIHVYTSDRLHTDTLCYERVGTDIEFVSPAINNTYSIY